MFQLPNQNGEKEKFILAQNDNNFFSRTKNIKECIFKSGML